MSETVKANYKLHIPKGVNKIISEKFKSQLVKKEKVDYEKGEFKEKVGEPHPFEYETIEGVAKKFGIIAAITDKISDYTLGPGMSIECEDEKVVEVLEMWMKKVRFQSFLRPWLREALLKGSGYIEIAGLMNNDVNPTLRNINSNNIYVKRDKYGTVERFTQLIVNDLTMLDPKNINELDKDETIQYNINRFGSDGYGMGIVYSSLSIIDDFLSAQTSMHKIMKRKANSQIHVKMGNVEAEDYPEQTDIDAFGENLTYMNDCTEWVTGPNVDMKILDFGNVGEKFKDIIENDLKLLSYAFQVPEMILGSDRGFVGAAEIQKDAFGRNIRSYQEQFGYVMKSKIFDKILISHGMNPLKINYNIIWGQPTDQDKNELRLSYKEILSGAVTLTPGMRMAYERKLAVLDNINYEDVEAENLKELRRENREKNKEFGRQVQLVQQKSSNQTAPKEKIVHDIMHEVLEGKAPQEIEMKMMNKYNLGERECKRLVENEIEELEKEYSLREWIGEYVQIKKEILEFIKSDSFEMLAATKKGDIALGKLSKKQIEKTRKVFETAFEEQKGINAIADDLKKIGLKDRYIMKDGKKVLSVSADKRAMMIARSESVRIKAEASLTRFDNKKIKEVTFTLVSARPCPQCESLQGSTYKIQEARGIIPVHSMCRCVWNQDEF